MTSDTTGDTFSFIDIPESETIADSASTFSIGSDDPTCVICGTALTYGGRGPKPKYCDEHRKNKPKSAANVKGSTRDVTAAANALKTLNGVIAVPLMMVAPPAGAEWSRRLPELEAQTLTILESDPALAKRLAAAGSKGGAIALALAYGMNIIPVLTIARVELNERRIARVEEYANNAPEYGA